MPTAMTLPEAHKDSPPAPADGPPERQERTDESLRRYLAEHPAEKQEGEAA